MTAMFDPATDGWKLRTLPGFIGVAGPLWSIKETSGWAYGMLAEDRHLNATGVVHGGMLCTLLDHVVSMVAWEANDRKPCVTVSIDVQFLSKARAGDFIVARAEIVRKAGTLAFMRGALTVDEQAMAAATAILKVRTDR